MLVNKQRRPFPTLFGYTKFFKNYSVSNAKIACTTKKAGKVARDGAIEVGVVFCIFVCMLYLFGCYESSLRLPESSVIQPDFGLKKSDLRTPSNEGGNDASTSRKEEESEMSASLGLEGKNETKPETEAETEDFFVPISKWPKTLRYERDAYETILHPGDKKTEMKVFRFWSPPLQTKENGKLMSRKTAMNIGTCITPDEKGNFQRGDNCPFHERTIYVSIASYRDYQCRETVESIFARAVYPERIRVGVVDQIDVKTDARCGVPIEPCKEKPNQALCKYQNQVDVYTMDAKLAVGPVFARHLAYRMYRGEYYSTQSDAHVTYTEGWDVNIITQFEETKNDMAVISTYLSDVQKSIDDNGHSLRPTRPLMCNSKWEGNDLPHVRHGSQPEELPEIHGTPQLTPWWGAGFSFSRGHFIVNVPYDLHAPMIFQGEEMSICLRGFTHGYDFYAPERSVSFHHYAVLENAGIRNSVPKFWEHSRMYGGAEMKSMKRMLGIVKMLPQVKQEEWDHAEEDIYGLGGVRTPEKFYETFGIDVVQKTMYQLCPFVGRKHHAEMHRMFTPHLRKDGMGINYSEIDYRYDGYGDKTLMS